MTADGVLLGMPALPPPVLAPRRPTRQLMVGSVGVGSEYPISVSVDDPHVDRGRQRDPATDRRTHRDRLRHRPGGVPSQDDADALPAIASKSGIPVIADIHFQPKYVFAAIEAGCAAVRVNPGNIKKFDDKIKEIAQAAKDHGNPDPDRRQRRFARPRAAGQVRQGHAGGAGRVGAVGGGPVRGARLLRREDLGQAQRPGRDDPGRTNCWPRRATIRCTGCHRGGPGVPGHHQVRGGRSERCCAGHRRHDPGVTGPAPPSRRSRSATRSSSR